MKLSQLREILFAYSAQLLQSSSSANEPEPIRMLWDFIDGYSNVDSDDNENSDQNVTFEEFCNFCEGRDVDFSFQTVWTLEKSVRVVFVSSVRENSDVLQYSDVLDHTKLAADVHKAMRLAITKVNSVRDDERQIVIDAPTTFEGCAEVVFMAIRNYQPKEQLESAIVHQVKTVVTFPPGSDPKNWPECYKAVCQLIASRQLLSQQVQLVTAINRLLSDRQVPHAFTLQAMATTVRRQIDIGEISPREVEVLKYLLRFADEQLTIRKESVQIEASGPASNFYKTFVRELYGLLGAMRDVVRAGVAAHTFKREMDQCISVCTGGVTRRLKLAERVLDRRAGVLNAMGKFTVYSDSERTKHNILTMSVSSQIAETLGRQLSLQIKDKLTKLTPNSIYILANYCVVACLTLITTVDVAGCVDRDQMIRDIVNQVIPGLFDPVRVLAKHPLRQSFLEFTWNLTANLTYDILRPKTTPQRFLITCGQPANGSNLQQQPPTGGARQFSVSTPAADAPRLATRAPTALRTLLAQHTVTHFAPADQLRPQGNDAECSQQVQMMESSKTRGV